ncbi:uncharacterized protein LOC142152726 [Mixophyes fleayi]|uniref:uncharacterized protein LOC142152726 n=1 Tax=Mixophyes fleayi TaxID=3061075 RepID=UPI003F4D92F1
MPRPRRSSARPARYRSPSPLSSRRHVAASPSPALPSAEVQGFLPQPQRGSVAGTHASVIAPILTSGRRGRATRSAESSGSRMRRPRPPSHSMVPAFVVSSGGGGGGGVIPVSTPAPLPAAVVPNITQETRVSPSRGSLTGDRGVTSSNPPGRQSGSSSEAFIQYPITPPILARRGDRLTYNPPAPHQLHFPPSPFLPHSGRGSSWGAHHGGAPLSDRGPFRPCTPGTDRVQSFRLGQRHVGSDRPSSGNLEVFGDSPLAPVRPSLSRHVLPAIDEWTYRSQRAPSPPGAYGRTSQFRPGPTQDNLVYDYHHSSGGNTSQWSPPRRTQSRPSGFYEEPYRALYDDFPPQRRVLSGGSYSPSPLLPPRLEPCGPALGSARRRLDYVPRSQLTAPLCVAEPAVANQEMRAVGGGRSGSESQEQRSAGIRVEPIPGSTDAQPGSASVVETSVAAGNPAPHDHQAGIRGLIEQAVAPSTLRTYQASWRRWSLFSGQKDQSEAGQRDAMLAFMWESYSKGESRASMASTLAGISFMARLQGYTDVTKGFMISKALKGWARTRLLQADARLPITDNILDQLIGTLGWIAVDEYEKTLFSVAFSMAFFGAFRVSELVAKSRGHQESGLQAEHVSLCGGVVSCKIIRSKTDQSGRGAWVQLHRQPNSNICPVNLVSRFMNMRPQARLFLCHHNGMPLTKYQFSAIMKKSLQSLNIDSSMYGTHSFRIGAATSAALAGSSTETIKALGR